MHANANGATNEVCICFSVSLFVGRLDLWVWVLKGQHTRAHTSIGAWFISAQVRALERKQSVSKVVVVVVEVLMKCWWLLLLQSISTTVSLSFFFLSFDLMLLFIYSTRIIWTMQWSWWCSICDFYFKKKFRGQTKWCGRFRRTCSPWVSLSDVFAPPFLLLFGFIPQLVIVPRKLVIKWPVISLALQSMQINYNWVNEPRDLVPYYLMLLALSN